MATDDLGGVGFDVAFARRTLTGISLPGPIPCPGPCDRRAARRQTPHHAVESGDEEEAKEPYGEGPEQEREGPAGAGELEMAGRVLDSLGGEAGGGRVHSLCEVGEGYVEGEALRGVCRVACVKVLGPESAFACPGFQRGIGRRRGVAPRDQ